MKVCLVSPFPPSPCGLNEYAYHLARELGTADTEVTVLADRNGNQNLTRNGRVEVIRCWHYNSPLNFWPILREIRRLDPDVVWFNVGFATMGHNPIAAVANLALPALFRSLGYFTHVTLHTLAEFSDLKAAGARFPFVARWGCETATRLLLRANRLSVLLPIYAKTLRDKYRATNVCVIPHGLFGEPVIQGKQRDHVICALGKWGTYKKLEFLIESFRRLRTSISSAELWIAGQDHPLAVGYLAGVEHKYCNEPGVRFLGYISENRLPEILGHCKAMAMPYTSSGGCSGVAHLACQYGLTIAAPDIPDFRDMAAQLPCRVVFFSPHNSESFTDALIESIRNVTSDLRPEVAEHPAPRTIAEVARLYQKFFHASVSLESLLIRRATLEDCGRYGYWDKVRRFLAVRSDNPIGTVFKGFRCTQDDSS